MKNFILSFFRKPNPNDAFVVVWNTSGEQTIVLVTYNEEHAKLVASITDEMIILRASGKTYPTTSKL